jgi:hypothetical protein
MIFLSGFLCFTLHHKHTPAKPIPLTVRIQCAFSKGSFANAFGTQHALARGMIRCNTTRKENWQGMNWIRQSTRLAIYLRDGLACAYCGASVEDGAQLSLDHLQPHSKGGDNKPTNLVTCCSRCNSARGNRSVRSFCQGVAEYLDTDYRTIERHVRACARRSMTAPRREARELIARRGSAARALRGE